MIKDNNFSLIETNENNKNVLFSDNINFYFSEKIEIDRESSKINIDKIQEKFRILFQIFTQNNIQMISSYYYDFLEKDEIKRIWNNIKIEEKEIRNNGLVLKNNIGHQILYKNPNYRVLWGSFDAFFDYFKTINGKYFLSFSFSSKEFPFLYQNLKNSNEFGLGTTIKINIKEENDFCIVEINTKLKDKDNFNYELLSLNKFLIKSLIKKESHV